MGKTSIEWTDWSANPIKARDRETGDVGHYCELISPGCAHCYSSRFQPRFGLPQFTGAGHNNQHRQERLERLEIFLDYGVLHKILSRRKPTKIFWEDMSDLFGEWVPSDMLDVCFAVMAMTPQHTHQVLTKRPQRMHDYLHEIGDDDKDFMRWGAAAGTLLDGDWIHGPGKKLRPMIERFIHLAHGFDPEDATDALFPGELDWPLPQVQLGVSAEDQPRLDERATLLLKTPAAVRFVSAEPLLGPLDFTRIKIPLAGESYMTRSALHATDALNLGEATPGRDQRLDWIIAGGESGDGARPLHPDWVRSIRDQCQAAGVAFFFKQWGAWEYYEGHAAPADTVHWEPAIPASAFAKNRLWAWNRDAGQFQRPSPDALVSQVMTAGAVLAAKVGKHEAGRLLDGREWSEFPQGTETTFVATSFSTS